MKEAVVAYRASMTLALGLLKRGLISAEEYCAISDIIARKHSIDLSTICCQNPLIFPEVRANMALTIPKGGDINGTNHTTD